MALGNTLREARMRLGLTTSEVASSTRMKVQLVEQIEHEDFSAIAAPIYGKGFIKLYAERVGLDPTPLIQEYMDVHVHKKAPPLTSAPRSAQSETTPEADEAPAEAAPDSDAEDLFSAVQPRTEPAEPAPATEAQPPERGTSRAAALAQRALDAAMQTKQRVVTLCGQGATALRNNMPDMRTVLKSIRFRDAPLKTIAIGAGVLIILLLIVSTLSRHITAPSATDDERGDTLRLAIDPPDPYLE